MKTRTRLFSLFGISLFILVGLAWAQSGGSIAYDETAKGEITNDDPVHSWTFEGREGDVITITMNAVNVSASGLDSYLLLLDADGEVLAENDDAATTTINAAIESFALPADGTYTIQASRFGLETGLAVGEYELTLTLVSQGAEASLDEEAQPIGFGETVTGSLSADNVADFWQFEAQEGQTIDLLMEQTSGDLDTFIRILDEENRELGRNDDSPDSTRSELNGFILPRTGVYIVVATRYGFESGTSSGDYSLSLTLLQPEPEPTEEAAPESQPTATPEPATIPATPEATPEASGGFGYGSFADGNLAEASATQDFRFEGQTGDMVTISVKRAASELDPYVRLLNAAGDVLAENDAFNGAADARIVGFILSESATYTIQVSAENETFGGFVVHLFADEQAAPPMVESVIPVPDVSGADLAISLTWAGSADFDLAVTDPNGSRLDFATLESESGGIFGGDANGGCEEQLANPMEAVYWEAAKPAPTGSYQIEVAFIFPCEAGGAVDYTVTVTQQGAVLETFEGQLTEGGLEIYEFTLD